jgi:hypothetical protein
MRRGFAAPVLLAVAGALAACGSASPSASIIEPTAFPATPTPMATPTPAPTSTPTATGSGPCAPGQFEIDILNTNGAAGTS